MRELSKGITGQNALGASADLTDDRFLNRECSDLAFMQRVLEEAENSRVPVLERVKFLAITAMLLDEFYRVRVTGLRKQIRAGVQKRSPDGLLPQEQLADADRISNEFLERQDRCWQNLTDDLRSAGISILSGEELEPADVEWLGGYFETHVYPALTPLIVDSSRPFPFLRDGEILLVLDLQKKADGSSHNGLLPLPPSALRFLRLPGPEMRFLALESGLELFLDHLFADFNIKGHGLARILREGDLKLAGDDDDLLAMVKDALDRREHAKVIRLKVDKRMPENLRRYLAEALGLLRDDDLARLATARRGITASEFVAIDGLLGLDDTMQMSEQLLTVAPPGLTFTAATSARPAFWDEFDGDMFAAIAAGDRLLHFPFDDFGIVVDFLKQAAADPGVTEIRQTLYRTGHDSPIVEALVSAAEAGKDVTAVVELEARDDEVENIELAGRLEAAGARVMFGFLDMKVHVKVLAVTRQEEGGPRSYINFATGNYHPGAARAYSDISLFSADPALAADAVQLFDYLTGGPAPENLNRIVLAPLGLRARLLELIERESDHARAGRSAAIWLKLNKLTDTELIDALYNASAQGVEIVLIIRGICCLRPGVPGLSETIRVKSVIGRFLEHSRILCFGNGHGLPSPSADIYLSSADWMPHKIDRRVETLVSLDDPAAKSRVQDQIMAAYLKDQAQSWALGADGLWTRLSTDGFSAQDGLMQDFSY